VTEFSESIWHKFDRASLERQINLLTANKPFTDYVILVRKKGPEIIPLARTWRCCGGSCP
jgi:hypothetical protein